MRDAVLCLMCVASITARCSRRLRVLHPKRRPLPSAHANGDIYSGLALCQYRYVVHGVHSETSADFFQVVTASLDAELELRNKQVLRSSKLLVVKDDRPTLPKREPVKRVRTLWTRCIVG